MSSQGNSSWRQKVIKLSYKKKTKSLHNSNRSQLPNANISKLKSSRNMSNDNQEMPQPRSTGFPRHQKKERWGTNTDKTNATYRNTNAQTKKNCTRRTTLEKKTTGGCRGGSISKFYSRKTSPLILMQLQITNICFVCIGVLYFICETSQWNTYNHKHCHHENTPT